MSMIKLKNKAFWSNKALFRHVEDTLRDNGNSSDLFCPITYGCYSGLILPASLLNEIVYMPFEGTTLPVAKDYDSILRQYDGNYKVFVKGGASHRLSVVETDISYKDYLKRLKINFRKLYINSIKLIFNRLKSH